MCYISIVTPLFTLLTTTPEPPSSASPSPKSESFFVENPVLVDVPRPSRGNGAEVKKTPSLDAEIS